MINSLKKIQLVIAVIAISITIALTVLILIYHNRSTEVQVSSLPRSTDSPPVFADNSDRLPQWRSVTIQSGDTLQKVFTKLNIPASDLTQVLKLHNRQIVNLKSSEVLRFLLNPENRLVTLEVPVGFDKKLEINRHADTFKQTLTTLPINTVVAFASGTVHSSLTQAMKNAGLSQKMYHQVTEMFGNQLNFKRSIHRNDRFAALYQEEYINGHKIRAGKVLACELKVGKKTFRSLEFTDPTQHTGYYTADGYSVEPRFLNSPLNYKRISSPFSLSRVDPVLHQVHPHLGVDFAANPGTPIRSVGAGRIVFIGKDHGYGNAIKIRYDNHYSALYAHMELFAKNLKLHQFIDKGAVIGYVGSTGWATGPHLHFGFYVDGVPRNWLTEKLPKSSPISRSYRRQFERTAQTMLAALRTHQETSFAENTTADSLRQRKS